MLKGENAAGPVPAKGIRRVATRRRDTREVILNTAEELLQQRGFKAFSYHHIAVRLGIRNAAVHYHFPSKMDLGVALVRRYRERFEGWTHEQDAVDCAWERMQNLFQTYIAFLDADCMCCPCGVLGAEFHVLPEPMQDETRDLMRCHHGWIVETLDLGRAQGAFQFPGSSEDKAVVVSAALQGGLKIARMTEPQRFHQVLSVLTQDLTGREMVASPSWATN